MLLLGLAVCGAVSIARIHAQDSGVEIVKVRKNFYMLAGAGGTVGDPMGSCW